MEKKVEFRPGDKVIWSRTVSPAPQKPKVEVEATFLYYNKRARIRLTESGSERNVQLKYLSKVWE